MLYFYVLIYFPFKWHEVVMFEMLLSGHRPAEEPLLDIWTQMSSGPQARRYMSMGAGNGKVYVQGGQGAAVYNDLWEYTIASDTWVQLTSPPTGTARTGGAGIMVGDKFYSFGGYNVANTKLNTLHCYDTTLGTWVAQPSGATARQLLALTAIGSIIYVHGGQTDSVVGASDLWSYDTVALKWTQIAATTPVNHRWGSMTSAGDNLYLFGGLTNTGVQISDLYRYNTITKVWTKLPAGPSTRYGCTFVHVNNKLYLRGGRSGGVAQNDHWVFDIAQNHWTQLTNGPMPIYIAAVAPYNKEIFLFGGDIGAASDMLWKYSI